MKKINYIITIMLGLLLIFNSCQQDEYELGSLIAPTNVELSAVIFGADDVTPYGDGSGMVDFVASADNAISYYFEYDDGTDKEIVADGIVTHPFTKNGVNKFNVTVFAVGTGGMTSSMTLQIEVFSNFKDEEASQFLTGGASKSWYWAADQPGHLGLGPNNFNYEPGSHTWAQWYMAAPWEKTESTLYSCELIFTADGDVMTFEQLTPSGEAFVQGIYASELGLGDEGSHPFDISGVKTVTFSPSASIATIDGDYRGTTMTFSDGGFMGFYAGTSKYEIIEITENILRVRMVQTNNTEFAWYHTFTNVKPAQ